MKVVDNRGLACPQPVINTKRALEAMGVGELISIVDNTVARENVLKFARSQGFIAESTEDGGVYRVTIRKGDVTAPPEVEADFSSQPGPFGPTLYLIGSDEFGRGGRDLGTALMKTFLYSLAEEGSRGNVLVFVNGGVKLACAGSAVLPSILRLQELGWEVSSCGTCLDFYELKGQLSLGEVTNMYSIVEAMTSASKIITL